MNNNGTAIITYDYPLVTSLYQSATPYGTYNLVNTTGSYAHANALTAPSYWQLKSPQGHVITTFAIYPFSLTPGQ